MGDSVIKVQNLWKEYLVGGPVMPQRSLRDSITGLFTNSIDRFRHLSGKSEQDAWFWALRDVNVEIEQGDIIGVIGRNGAGKSTLLKVLGRITAPTKGHIEFRGQLASLLEVGTGFHPELTGRENTLLNGAILGMSRRDIRSKLDEIVAFAEIEKFIDTPVKRYSSGMHVRLAFSVAAHLDADILLVDEVLAVGDLAFQEKCLARLNNVSHEGRTIVFVSHNMGTIATLCKKGIVFDRGEIVFHGAIEEAIPVYLKTSTSKNGEMQQGHFRGSLKKKIHFKKITINGQTLGENILIKPEEKIRIGIEGKSEVSVRDFDLLAAIFKDGLRILTMQDAPEGTQLKAGDFSSIAELPPFFLRPGSYSIGVGGQRKGMGQWVWGSDLGEFTVLEKWAVGYEERNDGTINYAPHGVRVQNTEIKSD